MSKTEDDVADDVDLSFHMLNQKIQKTRDKKSTK